MKIRPRSVDSILDAIEAVQQRVGARAAEMFRERGEALGSALEDWLKAERESIWRPAIEVRRTKDAFVIAAAAAGLDPKTLDVRVTPTELLLSANVHHSDRDKKDEVILCEFVNGPLFRNYRFPETVDPARVSAEYQDGMLRVTAPLAQPARQVAVTAA